ncbi:MarR family winged helix-turn-helix transcriptional regulator [Vibrio sp. HN007]|uniref:MarR family winged helix-turn-helix transcriptional regulator n=1 Tax=Vibrio iocasae TaxID=3098914 RepID=UPI0035D41FE1
MPKTETGEIFTKAIWEIFRLNGLLTIEGDQLAKEFGLSSARWKVMGAIVRTEGPLTVPQIGRKIGQSRQAVQRLVNAMKKDGLLLVEKNPNHKTSSLIGLTEKGFCIYQSLYIKQLSWAQEGARKLSRDELELTLTTLKKY